MSEPRTESSMKPSWVAADRTRCATRRDAGSLATAWCGGAYKVLSAVSPQFSLQLSSHRESVHFASLKEFPRAYEMSFGFM